MSLDAELRPVFTLETPWGSARVVLGVRGEHQVTNALLAATVALTYGAYGHREGVRASRYAGWRRHQPGRKPDGPRSGTS